MLQDSQSSEPRVSIVLPVRNEAKSVLAAIRSALDQAYSGELEVVVADGGSTDGTLDVLRREADRDARVRVVDNPAGITPAGLNAAIRASRGDVIVRIDAHSTLPPGYIERAVQTLHETGADNVGGVQDAAGSGLFQRAVAMAMSTPMGVGNARFHYGGAPGPVDTVYLGVFPRHVFDRVGLFDENLVRNQDYELNYRIRKAGGVVWFNPELRVAYQPRATVGRLGSQYFQYGVWKRRVVGMHPGSMKARQAAAPLLVVGMVPAVASLFTPSWWIGAGFVGSYVGSLVLTAVVTGLRRRSTAAVLLPVALATMHISWGTGFILETLRRFTRRSRDV